LVNLIIGLLLPSKGEINIDGVVLNYKNIQNWRSKIGYISQDVYLFDGTVAENICFGRTKNEELLNKIILQVNLKNLLDLKNGTDTFVGEGGIQLSGGQKQRIAIARALYSQPKILVLDEATSALDSNMERKIMEEIYQICEDKTLLIIAHRLSTIKNCDLAYKISNKSLVKIDL